MRHFVLTILCVLFAGASLSYAEDYKATFDHLDALRTRADSLRPAIIPLQRFAPDEIGYCLQLCDAIDQSIALCEFMMNRAVENGLDPAMQVDIVQQYAQVQQLYRQLQLADTQLARKFPH